MLWLLAFILLVIGCILLTRGFLNLNNSREGEKDAMIGMMLNIAVIYILAEIMAEKMKSISSERIMKNEEEEIAEELNGPDTYVWKEKLYITKGYIIDITQGIKITKISDILWMYRWGRSNTMYEIIIYNTKLKKSTIVAMKPKYAHEYYKIYNLIHSYCPDVIEGYSDESMKKVREYRQNRLV